MYPSGTYVNNGQYPTAEPGPGNSTTWDMVIQPYVKSTQLLVCPSDAVSGTRNMSGVPGYGTNAKRSYSIFNYVQGRSQAVVAQPSLTLMVGERDNEYLGGGGNQWGYYSEIQRLREMSARSVANAPFRHLDTSNMLYVDGHVKAYKGGITGYPLLPGHTYVDGNGGNWTNSDQDRPQ